MRVFLPANFYWMASVTFRFNKNRNSGGVLMYFREDIQSKLLSVKRNLEGFFVK